MADTISYGPDPRNKRTYVITYHSDWKGDFYLRFKNYNKGYEKAEKDAKARGYEKIDAKDDGTIVWGKEHTYPTVRSAIP